MPIKVKYNKQDFIVSDGIKTIEDFLTQLANTPLKDICPKQFNLFYLDEEGDKIAMYTTEDLLSFQQYCQVKSKNFPIKLKACKTPKGALQLQETQPLNKIVQEELDKQLDAKFLRFKQDMTEAVKFLVGPNVQPKASSQGMPSIFEVLQERLQVFQVEQEGILATNEKFSSTVPRFEKITETIKEVQQLMKQQLQSLKNEIRSRKEQKKLEKLAKQEEKAKKAEEKAKKEEERQKKVEEKAKKQEEKARKEEQKLLKEQKKMEKEALQKAKEESHAVLSEEESQKPQAIEAAQNQEPVIQEDSQQQNQVINPQQTQMLEKIQVALTRAKELSEIFGFEQSVVYALISQNPEQSDDEIMNLLLDQGK